MINGYSSAAYTYEPSASSSHSSYYSAKSSFSDKKAKPQSIGPVVDYYNNKFGDQYDYRLRDPMLSEIGSSKTSSVASNKSYDRVVQGRFEKSDGTIIEEGYTMHTNRAGEDSCDPDTRYRRVYPPPSKKKQPWFSKANIFRRNRNRSKLDSIYE